MRLPCACLLVLTLAGLVAFPAQGRSQSAVDEIRYEVGQGASDVRMQFKLDLLHMALTRTEGAFGPYRIVNKAPQLNTFRAMKLMQSGESLNVFIAVTSEAWERNTIPIRIPVRRGLLNYRLLLIHKDAAPGFTDIASLAGLRKMRAGSKLGWTTTAILQAAGFDVETSDNYDQLFEMLDKGRFAFVPRGVNEIYAELAQKEPHLKNLRIEPRLALYIPGATYVFVSPMFPRLAERLEQGLRGMASDGDLAALVDRYHRDDLLRADLPRRHLIRVDNPLLPPQTPLQDPSLWHDLLD